MILSSLLKGIQSTCRFALEESPRRPMRVGGGLSSYRADSVEV